MRVGCTRRGGALAALLMGVALALACVEEAPEPEVVARPVKLLAIGGPGSGTTLEFSGEIRPAQQADMGFEVAGKLVSFLVNEGQRVAAGTVLARLDPRDYESKLAEAEARASQAATEVERYRYLVEQGVNAPRDLELRERNYKVLAAELAIARKAVEDTVLRAPFAGNVARKLVEDRANVQAKEPVLILQDASNLEVRVSVPERDLAGGRTEDIDFDALNARLQPEVMVSALPDRVFSARLTELATAADPTTRTYQATFRFVNPPDVSVLPGMTARVRIQRGGRAVRAPAPIRVPAYAVGADAQNRPFVWAIDADSLTVHRRIVAVGEMHGDQIEVESGLRAGDVIAVSGIRQLREGLPVRPYEAQAER